LYWAIIEILRQSPGYRFRLDHVPALSMRLGCNVKSLVSACVDTFGLFESDGEYFYSPSLHRRMKARDIVVEQRRIAARKRWDASAMHPHSNRTATAKRPQCGSNARSVEKSRVEKNRSVASAATPRNGNKRTPEEHQVFEAEWEEYTKLGPLTGSGEAPTLWRLIDRCRKVDGSQWPALLAAMRRQYVQMMRTLTTPFWATAAPTPLGLLGHFDPVLHALKNGAEKRQAAAKLPPISGPFGGPIKEVTA
jgi:hypothetical protein